MRFAVCFFLAQMLVSGQVIVMNTAGGPAQAGTPAAPQQEVKPEDQCSVDGQILNATTSAPVKKAVVMLTRSDMMPGPNTGMPPSYSATSDEAGKFAMKGIDPGKYRLMVSRNGFVVMNYGARAPGRPGTTLSLDRAQTVKNIEIKLTPHGIVAGRILDEDGEPVPYVNVTLMRFQYQQGRKQLTPSGGASTNDLGEYRAFGVPPGKYYVSATARSGAMMGPAVVADRTPQPDEDYLPTYYPGTLDPASAIQVDVAAGATVNGINLTLSKFRTVHIKGRVTNTMLPGRRVSVMAMPRNTTMFNMSGFRSNQVDLKGSFDIRGVSPGPYWIYATLYDDGKNYTAKAPVDVGSNHVENVNLVLGAGADIGGVVRVEGEGTQDLSNVYVRLQPRDMGGFSISGNPGARVKADRSFVLLGAVAETFSVALTGLPDGFYVKAIKSGEVDVLAAGLDASKAAAPLEIVVSPNAGEVKGTVQNAKTSQPAPGASVVLVPQEKDRREQSTFYRMVMADQHGNYTFQSLPPGDYKVFAWEDLEMGAYMDPEFMKPVEEKGEAVSVKESDHKSVTLTMIPVDAH